MGRSTWADAQRLIHRWGAWGDYRGACTQERCSYQIEVDDLYGAIPGFGPRRTDLRGAIQECCFWLFRLYVLLGGRSTAVVARIEVIRGLIWGKDYILMVDVPNGYGLNGMEYTLFGRDCLEDGKVSSSYRSTPS